MVAGAVNGPTPQGDQRSSFVAAPQTVGHAHRLLVLAGRSGVPSRSMAAPGRPPGLRRWRM